MLRKHRCWGLLCLLALSVLAEVLAQEISVNSEDEKEEDKRVFGGSNERKYISRSKNSGIKGRSRVKGVKGGGKTTKQLYGEGCKRPENPVNGNLYCTPISGCLVSCFNGYKFPNGDTRLSLLCEEGEWQVQNTEWATVPPCEPICDPACQNNGICTAPDQCDCPENYNGPQCQYQSSPCLNIPPMPNNVKRLCYARTCTFSCIDEHHHFPDGSDVTNMLCKDGVWTPSRPDWVTIPDCKPSCDLPCENGGECLAHNTCECPQEFRGPQCQYDKSQCTRDKLSQVFNGAAICTDTRDLFSCILSCPIGATFDEPAASKYSCLYSEGVFRPQPPRCIIVGADVELLSPGSFPLAGSYSNFSYHTSYSVSSSSSHATNTSWTDLLAHHLNPGSFMDLDIIPETVIIEKLPAPGVCYTWSGDHYKTFDGRILSFQSNCSYVLVRDSVDGTFSVNLEWEEDHRKVVVYAQDRQYSLTTSNHVPVLLFGSRQMTIPASLTGVTVELQGNYVSLSLTALGVNIKWDGNAFVSVAVTQALWNRTAGLCGRIDGYQENDLETKSGTIPKRLITFADSWKVEKLEETCGTVPSDEHTCNFLPDGDRSLATEAAQFCSKLFTDPSFSHCANVVEYDLYFEACRWDYCGCTETDRRPCACNSLTVYIRECNRLGDKTIMNWRDDSMCPVNCTGGRVYSSCVPNTVETCGSKNELSTSQDRCEEGCYCPKGTVLHNQNCILKEQCPCKLRGKSFAPGESIPKGCNTCECINGQWECTQANCGARCSAIGDPHYVTFDGRHFDFMGKCSYYLVKGDNYSIETENVACAGSISEQMGFSAFSPSIYPSCTKTVTIHIGDRNIKLQQNREVTVNGRAVLQMPLTMDGATIRIASSIFLIVEMANGLELWWDGLTRLYIDAPASLKGQTKGLCGTFNQNQNDDFLTPENDVEQSVVSFANKWKTQETCTDLPEKVGTHPCEVNIQNKASAEELCGKIKGPLFAGCHWSVDPESYYQDCMYDLCSCEGKISQCLCPILASYAKECSYHGLHVDFRNDIAECSVVCPGGQKYQVCGNSCTRSCFDITQKPDCRRQCVEGCNCKEDETLDNNGECIPITHCTCHSNGVDHPPGYKEIRPGTRGLELCSCMNAVWDCHLATTEEIENNPDSNAQNCSLSGNEVYTPCEPVEPITCKNMHNPPEYSPAKCVPGCECKKGYVLDSHTKQCVLPSECPCHHGGKSYSDGHKMQEDCNVCTCEGGKWSCTTRQCPGVCTAWGDSHFKTFDGKIYDFYGSCNYMLAKGTLGNRDVFDIFIQNVPCSSSGITCSKSVTLKVGDGSKLETVTFVRDEPVPSFKELDRITVREAGLFVFAEVYDLGLVLQWDRATRVYIKVDPRWLTKVNGLCGNYNNDQLDDFQSPNGGAIEVSPLLFGDSWKLQSYCPAAVEIEDACALHPQRKVHALKKCGVLKSRVFQPCHSEVPLEPYLERCIFDTCACDLGGDCECLCTAISAYAQECNIRGVHIKWRTQQLCPVQCDEKCSYYSPCVETCPQETCDNHLVYKSLTHLCKEDSCVEGCEIKPCPSGQIYSNLTSLECVPEAKCQTVCLQVDGIIYKEGDIMEQDECHTCFCSRHRKICQGKPCTSLTPPPKTNMPETQILECKPGWSSWISMNVPGMKQSEEEPIPSHHYLLKAKSPAACSPLEVTDVGCRVVGTHEDYSDRMNKSRVTCTARKGLLCENNCDDYEIQVYCDCGGRSTPPGYTYPSKFPETTTSIIGTVPTVEECKIRPLKPDPADCQKFFECVDTPSGPQHVEKVCGAGTLFNPNRLECDWAQSVLLVRPECALSTRLVEPTPTPSAAPTQTTKPSLCVEGWTEWLNSTAIEAGDTEDLMAYISEGKVPCQHAAVTDIECKYYKASERQVKGVKGRPQTQSQLILADYSESGDKTVCDTLSGLRCVSSSPDHKCQDYAVRVFCSCGAIFTTSWTPYPPSPTGTTITRKQTPYPTTSAGTKIATPWERYTTPKVTRITSPRTPYTPSPTGRGITSPSTPSPPSPTGPPIITPPPEKCDVARPNSPHPSDCVLFYHCVDTPAGPQLVEKGCDPGTWFNPNTMVCDWPQSVLQVRPECATTRTPTPWERYSTPEATRVTGPRTPFPSSPAVTGPTIEKCDLTKLKTPDFLDCQKYYECIDSPNGPQIKEKKCGLGTLFNYITLACEWPQSVLLVRSECATSGITMTSPRPTFPPQPTVPRLTTTTKKAYSTTTAVCPPGEIWNDCAVPCDKMCQYYEHAVHATGECLTPYSCLQGCRPIDQQIDCPAENLWRDEITCVAAADCTCISKNGTSVKPGIPYWESECEVCQCVNNKYICDNSLCLVTTTSTPVYMTVFETPKYTVGNRSHYRATTVPPSRGTTTIIIIPSSTTPPIMCDKENLIHLLDGPKPLPPSALTASSSLSPEFSPQAGRLGNKTNPSEYSWTAQYSDKQQYLQVDLGREEPVYGAIVQGSPLTNEYVSSYKVLHSLDGQAFSYVTGKHNKPEVFRGPINSKQPVSQVFHSPVEARYIRFAPETWSQAISMKVELIGCSKEQPLTTVTPGFRKLSPTPIIVTIPPSSATTSKPGQGTSPAHTTPTTTLAPVVCIEPMGVEDGTLLDSQITVSSVLGNDVTRYGPGEARLNKVQDKEHEGAWIPATSTPNEWIQLDFVEPRNLTSIITQGLGGGNKWVEAYKVLYSHDGKSWSPIVNQDGSERVFPANFDGDTEQTNHFKNIIRAQYLRVVPMQWHNGIAMRLEVLGCFAPYPAILTTPPSITTSTQPVILPPTCQVCPTVPRESVDVSKCNCTDHQSWDGHKCVPKVECPCIVHKNMYKTGTLFFSEQCQQCMCTLDGHVQCESSVPCDKCGDGLQSVVTPLCACVCKPCPPNTTLCQTSNICISTSLWCDGVEDCPDDEKNCTIPSTPSTPSPPITAPITHKTPSTTAAPPSVVTPASSLATPPHVEITLSTPSPPETSHYTHVITHKTPSTTGAPPSVVTPASSLATPPHVEITLSTPSPTKTPPYTHVITHKTPSTTGAPPLVVTPASSLATPPHVEPTLSTVSTPSTPSPPQTPPFTHVITHKTPSTTGAPPSVVTPASSIATATHVEITLSTISTPSTPSPPETPHYTHVITHKTPSTTGAPPSVVTPASSLATSPYAEITPVFTELTPTTTSTAPVESTPGITPTTVPPACPPVSCPPGYKVRLIHGTKAKKTTSKSSRKRTYSLMGRYKGVRKLKGGSKLPPPGKTAVQVCPQFTCEPKPKKCTEPPTCPKGTAPVESGSVPNGPDHVCYEYKCEPYPAVCNVTGRTIMTFDSTEYQYDYCDHILARDTEHNNWGIFVYKDCSTSASCTAFVTVIHDMHELKLYDDQRVGIDGYTYNADQVQNMEYQDYGIYKVGNSLHMVSYTYFFWVTINSQSNIMIGVEGSLFGRVDGLCGFFDGVTEDDKRKVDGSIAHTTKEFGNSWAHNQNSEACKPVTCPIEIKEKALRLCSVVKDKPLSLCKNTVNVNQFIARCIESTCSCLKSGNKEEDCKCKALENFVTDCQMADNRIDLSSWRVMHDCPSSCPSGLVHYECYRRQCERSCSNLQEEDPCPTTSICFTGCFCPEGLVRDKDKCVKPSQCRDCVCDGFGDPQYISFDRTKFSFNGNCTYVAARGFGESGNPDFEVLVTNGKCKHDQKSTCTKVVTILYEQHAIVIAVNEANTVLDTMVDGKTVANYPFSSDWLILDGSPEKKLTVVIPKIQLEVSYFFENYGFVIQLPSHVYGGKTEGLCGNCNYDPLDDFKTSEGKLTNDTDKFGMSWLLPELSPNEECRNIPPPPCQLLPSEEDVCQNLLDSARFGECHAIVNPDSYYETCKSDVCNSTEPVKVACRVFEAYARECLREGVCLSWRSKHICPYQCDEGFEYRCDSGCTETCDNYELYRNDPSKCQLSKVEGCFCPVGKVLHDGTCVEESHCKPCDENGHYSGDKWNPDACTSCSCTGSMLNCRKTACPPVDRMCNPPLVPVIIVNASDTQCCPDYACRPSEVNQPCPEVQKPECKEDQVSELTTKADNCSTYVCRCKTVDECRQNVSSEFDLNVMPEDEAPLRPGMERVLDTTSCCERSHVICNKTKCPKPPQCPKFYKLQEIPASEDLCCSVYTCEPPSDVCLYEHQYFASTKGGERKRNETEKFTVEKKPGSTWQDGPCRECNCAGSEPGEYRPVCTITQCLKLADEPGAVDYVLEQVPVYGSCCPEVVRVACKDGNDVYQADSTWPSSSGDRCKTITCQSASDGTVQKVTIERTCIETCDLGFQYEPSPPESTSCCGQCKQVACVDEGKRYEKESVWYSPDHCIKFNCRSENGSFQIVSEKNMCGETPPETLANYVVERVSVPGECCERIKRTQCKQGDTVYEIGESWPSPDEKCKSFKCIASVLDNQALKEETRQACLEDCDKGWQYQLPAVDSGKCCGKCVQVGCFVNGTLYEDGDTWKVNCTTYFCSKKGDEFQIISEFPCSDDKSCPPEKQYSDGCCWKCNLTAAPRQNCMPTSLALENTVKLVKHHSKEHGLCVNEQPVKGFTECDGNCQSSTSYNSATNHHDSNCRCCQPVRVDQISVDLTCERGGFILAGYNVSVPTVCGCQVCSSSIEGELKPGTQRPSEIYPIEPNVDYGSSIPDIVY